MGQKCSPAGSAAVGLAGPVSGRPELHSGPAAALQVNEDDAGLRQRAAPGQQRRALRVRLAALVAFDRREMAFAAERTRQVFPTPLLLAAKPTIELQQHARRRDRSRGSIGSPATAAPQDRPSAGTARQTCDVRREAAPRCQASWLRARPSWLQRTSRIPPAVARTWVRIARFGSRRPKRLALMDGSVIARFTWGGRRRSTRPGCSHPRRTRPE